MGSHDHRRDLRGCLALSKPAEARALTAFVLDLGDRVLDLQRVQGA